MRSNSSREVHYGVYATTGGGVRGGKPPQGTGGRTYSFIDAMYPLDTADLIALRIPPGRIERVWGVPWLLWQVLRRSSGSRGFPRGLLGAHWEVPGDPWEGPVSGESLEVSGESLGAPWRFLEGPWGIPGDPWGSLAGLQIPVRSLGGPGRSQGSTWRVPGGSLGTPWRPREGPWG